MTNKTVEEIALQSHIRWLSKAKIAVIGGTEMTVLPYGYLSTAVEEAVTTALEQQAREDVERMEDELLEILEDETIVTAGDHPFTMKKVRCPENKTISSIRKKVKSLISHKKQVLGKK